ncbi:YedE family putative selenium transporter [Pasteurella testudinis]|uniref:YedE family putative selenium transporter n=1 Tax=Pasteurella testudinis TaxID=761 RepID=UPI0040586D77
MKLFTWPVVAGAALGIVAPILVHFGNPGNMGFCAACFLRDTSGALGFHRAGVVQYLRPELIGLVLGALASAVLAKEFKPQGGSSPLIRFMLGVFAMLGALVFLGCPWRAYLRLGGGDFSAIAGILGLIAGILLSLVFIKRGFSLGKSNNIGKAAGLLPAIFAVILLVLLLTRFRFGDNLPVFFSEKGPAAQHADIWLSLGAGMLIGVVMQRSRFCSIGSVRNFVLFRDSYLLNGIIALLIFTTLTNLLLGQFNPGFNNQPIAHNDYLWNFLGMALSGLCFALGGGCPGKQLAHLGEGDNDAAIFLLGMLIGAAVAHNFGLASSPNGITQFAPYALAIGFAFCVYIGLNNKSVV